MCKLCGNPFCPDEPDEVEMVEVRCFSCGAPVVVNVRSFPPQPCPACGGKCHQEHKMDLHEVLKQIFSRRSSARWN